ncbi:hypothetical protein DCO56_09320 [Sphingobacterium athyrii]|uniref:Uncharacterized protein n=1 Tax=Sphingobacterium athyrii TaxID=2152717 RepID=A0A363NWV0_9SPHI|nr:hypothetical protein DCO56_09320 [Sphingobacterium athyrii]
MLCQRTERSGAEQAHQAYSYDELPVLVEYTAADYVYTLDKVIEELHNWGGKSQKKYIGEVRIVIKKLPL